MILGVTGAVSTLEGEYVGIANAGKDTVANRFRDKHGFAVVSLADPLKRICKEIFDFTDEQLWGPSDERNKPDERYIRLAKGRLGTTYQGQDQPCTPEPPEDVFLTPRHALQQLGTEWGRSCYNNVWVDYALRVAHALLEENQGAAYGSTLGLYYKSTPADGKFEDTPGVVIPDVRFRNEIEGIRKAGGKVVRVVRPMYFSKVPDTHVSERQALEIPDGEFDYVIKNDCTLECLLDSTDNAYWRLKENTRR